MVARAAPAAAADGGNLVIGAGGDANNTGQTRTISSTRAPRSVPRASTPTSSRCATTRSALIQPASAGFTSYVNTKAVNAVYGYSQSNGNGVFAMSESGNGLFVRGEAASGR